MNAIDVQTIPRILILPRNASKSSLLVTLPHPRTSAPTQYYFCRDTGIYELTRVAAPTSSFRSCLLRGAYLPNFGNVQPKGNTHGELRKHAMVRDFENSGDAEAGGYVLKAGEILVATPVDPLFLLLPILSPGSASSKSDSRLPFLSCEDLFEKLVGTERHFGTLVDDSSTRERLQLRLETVCDVVDAGDERMYRLSTIKLLREMCEKAKRLALLGLSATLEERFVVRALVLPITSVRHGDTDIAPHDESLSGVSAPRPADSQSSVSTCRTDGSCSSTSTSMTFPEKSCQSKYQSEIADQLRLRTALSYILTSYCSPHLTSALTNMLESATSPLDFKLCDEHLAHIASLRAEALASRSLADFSRKRSMNEDNEVLESRAEKKSRKEEEERRTKAGQSRGVRDLKKVNITGMKKMSDFFGKRALPKT